MSDATPRRPSPLRPNPLRNRLDLQDPSFIDRLLPVFRILERYFRYEARGLRHVPDDRSSIVVLNHGIIPWHGFLLYQQLILQRGIYPRGLSAGFIYDVPLLRELFLKGGAVNANWHNGQELLAQGNCLMIAPGGIYESLVCRPGMTRIPWERRLGFAELAVRTGTPIVPTYCHGANDVYFNSQLLLRQRIKVLEATRLPIPGFYGIGLLPLPVRLVHVAGPPISSERQGDESHEDQVARVHAEVVVALEDLAAERVATR